MSRSNHTNQRFGKFKQLGRRGRRGAMLVLIAVLLPVMLILAAFAINLSYIELARTEMRVASDAAARASGRELSLTGDSNMAITAGKAAALRNQVGGVPLTLQNEDFVFGLSTRSSETARYSFSAGSSNPNAVQVTASRTSTSGGPIPLLLTSVLGRDSFDMTQSSISTRSEVDVALVLDRSGSMAYAANEANNSPNPPAAAPPGWDFCDAAPPRSRWLDVVNGVSAFLAELTISPQDEKVALCTYNGTATKDVSLTSNHSQITAGMATYTASFCNGNTNVGGGIEEATTALEEAGFERSWASKVIVVMTDGLHNTGTDPETAAQNAANNGIMVFTITFSDEADQTTMADVASIGTGEHFHASTAADLVTAFQNIARRLPTLLTK